MGWTSGFPEIKETASALAFWLSPSGTAEGHFRVHYSKINCLCRLLQWNRLEISLFSNLYHPLSHFGTGEPSSNFSTLSILGFSTADKSFVLGQLLKVVHGGKIMFILIDTSPGLGIIARWGPLPINMVLRSEESLKSEMLSLVRTSKYVKNTSMLSINKSEVDS